MSAFDGTWRPDPQLPGPDAPVEELRLAGATYACLTCSPSYEVPADGQPHPVADQEWFDALAITIVDDRTVRRVAYLQGIPVLDATTVLSPFGQTKRETQRQLAAAAMPVEFAITSRRIGPPPVDAHALSGRWQRVEADLPNHEEDTQYRVEDRVLHMRDGFGRSFKAPLDGTRAPYGGGRFTTVSVRQLDERTIEEVDWQGDEAVLTTTWTVSPDGQSMHVRFEHANGLVQEQDGRRLD